MYQKYLEPIVEEFTTGEYYREVYNAKLEFFDKAGIVYEDDPEFEQRMCIFMDWYLFDRDLPGIDLPPIKYFLRKHKERLSEDETNVYKDLCTTVHSIFTLKRRTFFGKNLIVKDLFSGKRFVVLDADINRGFSRGDLFEGRIILFRGTYEFSQGFCFHPVEVRSFILNEIKKVKFQDRTRHTKLILQLSSMKLEHARRPQIDVSQIYSFESKFKSGPSHLKFHDV